MKARSQLTGTLLGGAMLVGVGLGTPVLAQVPILPPDAVRPPQPNLEPDPSAPPDELPPLEELFPPAAAPDSAAPPSEEVVPEAAIVFTDFRLQGSLAFDDADLTATIQEKDLLPTDRPASFSELVLIAQATRDYYTEKGYLLAEVNLVEVDEQGVAILEVREWEIGDIEVTGLQRLRSGYVASRLALATDQPVAVERLQNALRLLQSDPLIRTFEATLGQDAAADTATLSIDVREAETFTADLNANNHRSESIGTTEQGVQLQERNVLGFGDRLTLTYDHTEGSDRWAGNYMVPLSPHNTTLTLSYATSESTIIQPPFDVFDIESTSRYYDVSLRQPLLQTPEEELALGLTFSRWETESRFLEGLLGESVPLQTLGSDEQGRTRLSVLRFSQDWTRRDRDRVLALRSQFNLGLDVFDATVSDQSPDGRFFSWQGQGQYVQRVAPDTFFLLRGTMQLSDRPLVPLEQLALGGAGSVRGYRRDAITGDNGALLAAELQVPLLGIPEIGDGLLQIAPFVEAGWVWNNGDLEPTADTLAAVGLGLRWRSNGLAAQLDYGMPIINAEDVIEDPTLRFSLTFSPF